MARTTFDALIESSGKENRRQQIAFSETNLKKMEYYNKHYQIVTDLYFVANAPVKLCDHKKAMERECRFCGRSKPEVNFRKKAHAVPEFLGNKSLISMNECDICNKFFADEYEDHLAKWFGPMRSLCQMRGKKGAPKYKSDEFTSARGDKGMELFVNSDSSILKEIKESGSGSFKIPVPMYTQPFIPVRAAKAFIKSAISILPQELLSECENTIQWLLGKATVNIDNFPVMYAFTPGVNPYRIGKAMICRRKMPDAEMPFLWLIIATTNFLFQIMIPFCKSDRWIKHGKKNSFEVTKFPTPFPEEYEKKYGKTVWYCEDWASDNPVVQNREASFHVDKIEEINVNKKKNKK
ncbi:MAG: hypothetical protein KAJ18_11455 [Candidatus Omnitrophica bacterium]|nr:hypothetical protein [Candidatus Omnitrophota bacterium]